MQNVHEKKLWWGECSHLRLKAQKRVDSPQPRDLPCYTQSH
jgi:hypothetical protein